MNSPLLLDGSHICVVLDEVEVLTEVSITARPGEVLGLLGPNGAGKTTLLSVLAGIQPADRGEVTLGGEAIARFGHRLRAQKMAYLPQHAHVHWPLTVANVVALGRLPHRGSGKGDDPLGAEAVEHALSLTEMSDFAHRTIDTLSGGELMRALVARMLAVQADILLADEPVTGLDPYFQLQFMDLFRAQAQAGKTVVLVLHDLALAARYCDRVVLLDQGKVVAEGTPQNVLNEDYLRDVYRIEAVHAGHQDQPYIVPWTRTT